MIRFKIDTYHTRLQHKIRASTKNTTQAHKFSKQRASMSKQYNPRVTRDTDLFLLEQQQALQQRQSSPNRTGRPLVLLMVVVVVMMVRMLSAVRTSVRTDLVGSYSWHATQNAFWAALGTGVLVQRLQFDRFVAATTRSALAITQAHTHTNLHTNMAYMVASLAHKSQPVESSAAAAKRRQSKRAGRH